MRSAAFLLLLLPASAATRPAPAPVNAPVQITEWTVPWEKTRPRDPYVDRSGRVWFVGQAGNYVAYLNPASGEFKRFEIEPGTNPHNLIVDGAGMVWYSGNRNGRIVKLDPATGKSTIYMMPDKAVRDPHTLIEDASGNIWFTAQFSNYVGHLVTKTGQIHLIPSPTKGSRPYGIVIDPKNRPWFVEFDPNMKAVKEWPLPSAAMSLPYAMASDDRDRLWLVETGVQPNRLVGFDPKSESWFSVTPVEKSGGLTIRHMIFDKTARSIWFGTDANTIGRAAVP